MRSFAANRHWSMDGAVSPGCLKQSKTRQMADVVDRGKRQALHGGF
jgi:hypothetical protein